MSIQNDDSVEKKLIAARAKRITVTAILAFVGLLPFAALIVIGILLQERYPALIWIAIACTLAYVIACTGILLKVSKHMGEEPEEESAPYEIRHPLFKTISEQYDKDGLADFVNYVSLRGWKLGYVDRKEASIEFIFLRKDRQAGVVLGDGTAEVSIDVQSEEPQDTVLDMDAFGDTVELWNAIIAAGRSAARRTDGEPQD